MTGRNKGTHKEGNMADAKIDSRGMRCPLPIAQMAAKLKKMEMGETLEINADDAAFSEDVKAFCRVSGNELVDLIQKGTVFTAIIRKK